MGNYDVWMQIGNQRPRRVGFMWHLACMWTSAQLSSADFARELADGELDAINLREQRASVCAFNTVYALLALNLGLCELLALGGALIARGEENSGVKTMRALQYCMSTAMFGEVSCMEGNSHGFVEVLERSTHTADGRLYDQEGVQDAASLLHNVLWMLWGTLRQGD